MKKALYGLKQSGRVWNQTIHAHLVALGYKRTRTDSCVYTITLPDKSTSYIALYVDDLLFVGSSMVEISRVKGSLATRFGIKDLGEAQFILGLQISRDVQGNIWLGQRAYLEAVLDRFGMSKCRPYTTPMEPNLQLDKAPEGTVADPILKHKYLQAVGSLMYAMLGTRPDLCFAVGYLSRFSSCPLEAHWTAITHVLRYLAGTLDLGLHYKHKSHSLDAFLAYTDSDWAADVNTSRSTMGFTFLQSGAAICWASRLQPRCTGSSTEAEYLGINFAAKQAIHLSNQLLELNEPLLSPLLLFGDNQGAIALSKEARFHSRTKHIRLDEHTAREYVERGELKVEYIPTGDMVADIMTKSLPFATFDKLRSRLGLVPNPSPLVS